MILKSMNRNTFDAALVLHALDSGAEIPQGLAALLREACHRIVWQDQVARQMLVDAEHIERGARRIRDAAWWEAK